MLTNIYETTNIANHKRANHFYTAMINIFAPIFSIPIACLSFYLYFVGGRGPDAFQLACPALYVPSRKKLFPFFQLVFYSFYLLISQFSIRLASTGTIFTNNYFPRTESYFTRSYFCRNSACICQFL